MITTVNSIRSEPQLLQQDQTEISKRSSALWECVARNADLFDGYLYTFRLRAEYDNVTPDDSKVREACRQAALKKRAEILPAGEYLGSEIRFLQPDYPYAADLAKLGYAMKTEQTGVYLVLPDKEAFLARWKFLQKATPSLPEISIVSCPDVADDKTFIEAFYTHDVLLSRGKEFVHDHFAHLIRTIKLIFSSGDDGNPTYKEEKERLVRLVDGAYRPIKDAEKLIAKGGTALSASSLAAARKELATQVDLIWARQDYDDSATWVKDCSKLQPLWSKIDHLAQMLAKTSIK